MSESREETRAEARTGECGDGESKRKGRRRMTGQTCALPGCYKPPWPSVREGGSPPLACGNLHHQLLMAGRFNPELPRPYQVILERNADSLCALLSCKEPPFVGHSWCSRTHYLLWLSEFTSSLRPDQICMLPGCTRHVFVDDNAPPSQFCGWRHKQEFVMLSALQHHPVPSVQVPPQPLPLPAASLNESECGRPPPSLNSLMLSLKQFASSANIPKNIRVIEDFYEKHPSEVFTEGHACWLIARLNFRSKGRKRKLTTKGHYHWKQSGPQYKKSKYTEKYYTYTKMKGKEKEADQLHAESSYTMKEYTMEDVKCHSLIHLVKEKPSSDGKLGKEQPSKQQSADQVDNGSSQGTVTWDDYMSVDSMFRDLPFDDFTVDNVFSQGTVTWDDYMSQYF